MISAPKRYRGGASRVRKVGRPVGNIDLAPTILDLTGARPCSAPGHCRTMDGRSLMPLLRRSGRGGLGRALLTEYRVPDAGRYATCEFAGIRTRDSIYVADIRGWSTRAPVSASLTDERERYNLKRDPFELRNQCFGGGSGSCPVGAKQLDLELRLSQLRDCAGVAGRDPRAGARPFPASRDPPTSTRCARQWRAEHEDARVSRSTRGPRDAQFAAPNPRAVLNPGQELA